MSKIISLLMVMSLGMSAFASGLPAVLKNVAKVADIDPAVFTTQILKYAERTKLTGTADDVLEVIAKSGLDMGNVLRIAKGLSKNNASFIDLAKGAQSEDKLFNEVVEALAGASSSAKVASKIDIVRTLGATVEASKKAEFNTAARDLEALLSLLSAEDQKITLEIIKSQSERGFSAVDVMLFGQVDAVSAHISGGSHLMHEACGGYGPEIVDNALSIQKAALRFLDAQDKIGPNEMVGSVIKGRMQVLGETRQEAAHNAAQTYPDGWAYRCVRKEGAAGQVFYNYESVTGCAFQGKPKGLGPKAIAGLCGV